jgi:hypothetical protein
MYLHEFRDAMGRALHRSSLQAPVKLGDGAARRGKEPLGTRRIRHMQQLLDGMGLVRSYVQKQFHDGFIRACACHLYAQDTVSMGDIMLEHGWDHVRQSVLTLTPRRYGKTTAVASFLAAYVLAVSDCEVSVFSTGKRASQKMLDLVADLVCKAGGESMICKHNCENLWLRGPDGDTRKCNSYPSAVSTLRGVGGDVLVLEEAAFIDHNVFLQVIVPLMQMENTSLIAISTPQGEDNFYSKMFDLTDASGRPFFVTMRVGLICDACRKLNAKSCPHVVAANVRPPWQSDLKHDLVTALYDGNENMRQAEILGQTVDDQSACFAPADVENFLKRHLVVQNDRVRTILTAMDPNGGGAGSEAALISACLVRNHFCVLAVSSRAVRGYDQISAIVREHLQSVSRRFPRATQVFCCENNLGNESSWTAAEIRRHRMARVKIAHEKSDLSGVRTTAPRKALYVGELQRYFCTNAIGLHPHAEWMADATPDKMQTQLCAYKRVSKTNKIGTVSHAYTGKNSGPDDLALCIGLCAYWLLQYHQGLLVANV